MRDTVDPQANFAELEEEVLQFWGEQHIFEKNKGFVMSVLL
jgi:hypothetical protein